MTTPLPDDVRRLFPAPIEHSGRTPYPGKRVPRLDVPSYVYPQLTSILDQAKPLIQQAIAIKQGARELKSMMPIDIVEWAESRFFIPITSQPISLMPHQRGILRLAFTRDATHHFPYQTVVYSTIKQSGKTSIAGLVGRWYTETGLPHSEVYCIGNDKEQSKTRAFREARRSIELTPGYDPMRERLPGEWALLKESMRCLLTGSELRALAVDAKGEAGGKPAIQLWTEVWGVTDEDGKRFWDELTPIPTIPDSVRIVETYAGYLDESVLLYSLYSLGKAGRQLTARDFGEMTGEDPFISWHEVNSLDDKVPVYENKAASLLMYWDEGVNARRMPWQLDERGKEYYRTQEQTLLPPAFRRLHFNEWVSPEANFIKPELWDACYEDHVEALAPGDRTPVVLAVDAATTGDSFAITALSRCPLDHSWCDARAARVWDPKESGGVIDYDEPEAFLRFVAQGGHYTNDFPPKLHPRSLKAVNAEAGCERCRQEDFDIPGHNVVQITYDPYQLESMMQRLRKDEVTWCEPFSQAQERLIADRGLYDAVIRREIHLIKPPDLQSDKLRQHALNAGAKLQSDQDSTLRLVKVTQARKIDAVVSLSMGRHRCLYLNI